MNELDKQRHKVEALEGAVRALWCVDRFFCDNNHGAWDPLMLFR